MQCLTANIKSRPGSQKLHKKHNDNSGNWLFFWSCTYINDIRYIEHSDWYAVRNAMSAITWVVTNCMKRLTEAALMNQIRTRGWVPSVSPALSWLFALLQVCQTILKMCATYRTRKWEITPKRWTHFALFYSYIKILFSAWETLGRLAPLKKLS